MSPLVKYCARNHRTRPFTSLLIIGSLTLVAFALAAVAAIAFGLTSMFHETGSPRRAIVLSNGSSYDLFSKLPVEDVGAISVVPGVEKVSPENAFILDSRMPDGTLETVRMVGLEDTGFDMHGVEMLEGRRPAPTALEYIVGKKLLDRNPALGPGHKVKADRYELTCVGVFHADAMLEAGLVTTRGTLATDRGKPWLSDIVIEAASPAAADELVASMNKLRSVDVNAFTEPTYYTERLKDYRDLFVMLSAILAMVVLGGAFAATATLSVVQNRRIPDMGALRAVGFKPRTLTLMMLIEIQAMALLAALVGGGAAWLALRGYVAHFGFGYGPVSFTAEVTSTIFIGVLAVMSAIGLMSSLLPLRRVRRINVISVIRD